MTTVALIEDDPRILSALQRALVGRGFHVLPASQGLAGLRTMVDQRPDAVILDLGLPDIDGLELLRMMRAVSDVPVIAATARDDEAVIIRTLHAGADDYLVKPFTIDHLEARLAAVLRRVAPRQQRTVVIGGLTVDTSSRVVTVDGRAIELTRKEFDLLAHLASQPGHVFSKRDLLAAVWDQPYGGADKTVDVHLSWLRRKLGETAATPHYLQAVRGVGVKLVGPTTAYASSRS